MHDFFPDSRRGLRSLFALSTTELSGGSELLPCDPRAALVGGNGRPKKNPLAEDKHSSRSEFEDQGNESARSSSESHYDRPFRFLGLSRERQIPDFLDLPLKCSPQVVEPKFRRGSAELTGSALPNGDGRSRWIPTGVQFRRLHPGSLFHGLRKTATTASALNFPRSRQCGTHGPL